jgi:uncharacterized protein (DUF2252 family)
VRDLLDQASARERREFLDHRTELRGGRRRIRIDGEHALAATRAAQAKVKRCMRGFASDRGRKEFFEVLDVARRIAGTGSLGVERYIVLVHGKGSPDQNHLVDIKYAMPSAPGANLPAELRRRQPRWGNDAERVVAVQKRMQAASPAYLSAVVIDGGAFVLRELQPLEDRLDLQRLAQEQQFENALFTMGQVTAWAQLRSGGRQGSAIADDWMEFARKGTWIKRLARYSRDYFDVVERDWRMFRDAQAG